MEGKSQYERASGENTGLVTNATAATDSNACVNDKLCVSSKNWRKVAMVVAAKSNRRSEASFCTKLTSDLLVVVLVGAFPQRSGGRYRIDFALNRDSASRRSCLP